MNLYVSLANLIVYFIYSLASIILCFDLFDYYSITYSDFIYYLLFISPPAPDKGEEDGWRFYLTWFIYHLDSGLFQVVCFYVLLCFLSKHLVLCV